MALVLLLPTLLPLSRKTAGQTATPTLTPQLFCNLVGKSAIESPNYHSRVPKGSFTSGKVSITPKSQELCPCSAVLGETIQNVTGG